MMRRSLPSIQHIGNNTAVCVSASARQIATGSRTSTPSDPVVQSGQSRIFPGPRSKKADNEFISLEKFKGLPHVITLLAMSGSGKTVLSTSLRKTEGWFHYSADYRIGTRYLAERIMDNIKCKIMEMQDPFIAHLLKNDSIYINHKITVDNLAPVSTYLGMYGDPDLGGLGKPDFLERQDLYRRAEIESMLDVPNFVKKAWDIYRCHSFINDASGSLCEIVNLSAPSDPVLEALRQDSLILYLVASESWEAKVVARATTNPKPLFYNPEFIRPIFKDKPRDAEGINPQDFARPLFQPLLDFRKPRYLTIADETGFTIPTNDLFVTPEGAMTVPDADSFLSTVYDRIVKQAKQSDTAARNLETYLKGCSQRQLDRSSRTSKRKFDARFDGRF